MTHVTSEPKILFDATSVSRQIAQYRARRLYIESETSDHLILKLSNESEFMINIAYYIPRKLFHSNCISENIQ